MPLDSGGTVTAVVYKAVESRAGAALVLAHGAGAGQHSPFMTGFAKAFASLGLDAITFNFLLPNSGGGFPTAAPCSRRATGASWTPLDATWRAPADFSSSVASRWAGALRPRSPPPTRTCPSADSCCSGIRFIPRPAGRPARRTFARASARCSSFRAAATTSERRESSGPILARFPSTATLRVVAGGDRSYKVARASEQVQAAVFDDVQRAVVEWIQGVVRLSTLRRTSLRAEGQRPLPPGSSATEACVPPQQPLRLSGRQGL